eukprot:TRINITY_DN10158_c0_g1_i2.p2 TRINITY_DN10158_c0_g1~~TRINITY_DN10158_c0_g1_i2.p2  ORF type:complete len:251 (-),score=38.90 TRINITY_DN10158_c0_g1_i2:74-826(-)
MKSLVLLLLVTICLGDAGHWFRFKNGTAIIRGKEYSRVIGTLGYTVSSESKYSQIAYMAMAFETMTPIGFFSKVKMGEFGDFNEELLCDFGRYEREEISLGGTVRIRGTWEKAELIGNCHTVDGKPWSFAFNSSKAKDVFYTLKEAGVRAKYLVGQSINRYKSYEIIGYAIIDFPYQYRSCERFFGPFFYNATDLEPGIIIVGKDGKHCAIVDNEGSKFIHSNSVKKIVTLDSIAVMNRYFSKGVYYKRY